MPYQQTRERSIFLHAIELESDEQRLAYLDEACGRNGPLRRAVDNLLQAHHSPQGLLDLPDRLTAEATTLPTLTLGTTIGPYKLLEVIGEGGFGVVYRAGQVEPIRREVALKIVKPGMDSREVVGRFEAERQALALMDHPNIAQVLDAGTTESGHPYFVMELVKGVPLTDYCDACRLETPKRLELFVRICRAVQHAHQKGIIHRDLKPSNVLVAMQDGQPAPKIIDFGVAKALGQKLTSQTLRTQLTQMVGTPMYMSPEQAELSPIDIDTRSDIYSLGVLLYELLAGTTPFPTQRLREASFDELRRIIREEDPPRPSTRVSTLAADIATTVADKHRLAPRQLAHDLRGDLDWIVMTCLEKDRTRRYETAADLARDVERHLADEPVHARPPSRGYRVKKFIRKHRGGVAAAAAVLLALSAGIAFTAIGLARAVAARDRAQANLLLGRQIIDEVVQPAVDDIGMTPHVRGVQAQLVKKSVEFYEKLDARSGGDPDIRVGLANTLTRLNSLAYLEGGDAITPASRAIELLMPVVEAFPTNPEYRKSLAFAYSRLAEALDQQFRFREGVSAQARSLELLKQVVTERPRDKVARDRLIDQYYSYGSALHGAGQLHIALEQRQAALQLAQSADSTAEGGSRLVKLHGGCAEILFDLGRYEETAEHLAAARRLAEQRMAAPLEIRERFQHEFWVAVATGQAGLLNICLGKPRQAHQELLAAIERLERAGAGIAEIVWVHHVLGYLAYTDGLALTALGRTDEAMAAYERAISFWRGSRTPGDLYHVALAQWRIGELSYAQGDVAEANEHLAAALREFTETAERLPGEPFAHDRLVVFLCECPDPALRDYDRAVRLAEEVISDSNGLLWRYLGLARYRSGDWAGAEEAIKRGMDLRNSGDAVELLLLAGAQAQAGRRDRGRETYAAAQKAITDNRPVYYGHIGVLGFHEIHNEVHQVVAPNK